MHVNVILTYFKLPNDFRVHAIGQQHVLTRPCEIQCSELVRILVRRINIRMNLETRAVTNLRTSTEDRGRLD